MYNTDMTKGNIIPARVKRLREDLFDSQEDFVRAWRERFGSGPHQTHISAIERGEKGLSLERLVQLAELLETTTDYLLGLSDDPIRSDMELDDELYQLIQVAKQLRPHRMADLIAIAETYRDTKQNSRQLMAAVLEAIADEGGVEQRDRLIAFMESATPGGNGLLGGGRTSAGDEGEQPTDSHT